MNYPTLGTPPEGYRLEKALLTTYDLDLPLLQALIGDEDPSKFTIVRGDGDLSDLPEDDPKRSVLHERILLAAFPRENGRPTAFIHGKIWLFIYAPVSSGKRRYQLVIHSANLYPYDNLETGVWFWGEETETLQPKTEPLCDYIRTFLRFTDPDRADLATFSDLIQSVRFTPCSARAGSWCPESAVPYGWKSNADAIDWEICAIGCGRDGSFLLEPYDELLVIAPFPKRETLKQIASARRSEESRCTVLTNVSSLRDLLTESDMRDKETLPAEFENIRYLTDYDLPETSFFHAKCYLRRRGSHWDLWCGSMSPSDAAMHQNLEMMVHFSDPAGISSPEGFLSELLNKPEEEIRSALEPNPMSVPDTSGKIISFKSGDSPVFKEAASHKARMTALINLLKTGKHRTKNSRRLMRYLLTEEVVRDLILMLHDEKMPSVPELKIIRANGKNRELHFIPLEERAFFSLLNHIMHRFDDRFSPYLYSHIRGRANAHALQALSKRRDFRELYIFRTDISRYDYSMDADLLAEYFRTFFPDDPSLCLFFDRIIHRRTYIQDGVICEGGPAILTGSAICCFCENLYLRDFDLLMEREASYYSRCTDDILIGAETPEALEQLIAKATRIITEKKLRLNETKSVRLSPGEAFIYLGWKVCDGKIDYSDKILQGYRKIIHRQTIRILRLYEMNDVDWPFRIPRAIRYAQTLQKRLCIREAFPILTSTEGLRQIDHMLCNLIRISVTGKKTNAKFRLPYKLIQKWGYRSLVRDYYLRLKNRHKKETL